MNSYSVYSSPEYQRARAEREADRARQEREAEAVRAQAEAENRAAGARYRAQLQAKRDAEHQRQEAQIDAELAAEKVRIGREWLAHHPDRTAEDFARHAWPQLRANLVEQRRAKALEQTREELRASGRYAL